MMEQTALTQIDSAETLDTGAITALRFLAWVYLLASSALAIYVWSTMSSVEVTGSILNRHVSNPFGIFLGFACALQGVVACPLLLTLCFIAERLLEISKAQFGLK